MQDQVNNGGPAFPVPHTNGHDGRNGMTLRDYFAAHAPSKPAPWFSPKTLISPHWSERHGIPMPHGDGRSGSASAGHCGACDEYFRKSAEWDAAQEKRRSEYEMACHVEWPWAYADAMLRARGAQ